MVMAMIMAATTMTMVCTAHFFCIMFSDFVAVVSLMLRFIFCVSMWLLLHTNERLLTAAMMRTLK
jgi:hypothetical protein